MKQRRVVRGERCLHVQLVLPNRFVRKPPFGISQHLQHTCRQQEIDGRGTGSGIFADVIQVFLG